jgi:SAM-dependent methyltransferase
MSDASGLGTGHDSALDAARHTAERSAKSGEQEKTSRAESPPGDVAVHGDEPAEFAASKVRLVRELLPHGDSTANLTLSKLEIDYLFNRFMCSQEGQRGLKLQFGSSSAHIYNDFWIAIDLAPIDSVARQGFDITFDFQDEQFDRVLCLDLDRVSRPVSLIAELRRVLKRGGQLWTQAPVSIEPQPNPGAGAGPRYWGFTPAGLRVLFERFDEIRCAMYQTFESNLRKDSVFYGLKPEIPLEACGAPPRKGKLDVAMRS